MIRLLLPLLEEAKLQGELGERRKKMLDGLGGDEKLARIHASMIARKKGNLPKTSFG